MMTGEQGGSPVEAGDRKVDYLKNYPFGVMRDDGISRLSVEEFR